MTRTSNARCACSAKIQTSVQCDGRFQTKPPQSGSAAEPSSAPAYTPTDAHFSSAPRTLARSYTPPWCTLIREEPLKAAKSLVPRGRPVGQTPSTTGWALISNSQTKYLDKFSEERRP